MEIPERRVALLMFLRGEHRHVGESKIAFVLRRRACAIREPRLFTAGDNMTKEEMDKLRFAQREYKGKDEIKIEEIRREHVLNALNRIVAKQLGEVVAKHVTKKTAVGKYHPMLLDCTNNCPTTSLIIVRFPEEITQLIPSDLKRSLITHPYEKSWLSVPPFDPEVIDVIDFAAKLYDD